MPKKIRKLKIGYVLDDGLDRLDGVQQYVLTISRWMKQQGHEVHYLCGETSTTDIENLHSLSRNLKVQFNGNGLTSPLPASNKKIKRLLAREMFDVLHIQVPYSPFMAAKVIKFAPPHTAIIGTFHILPYNFLSRYGNRVLGFMLRRNLRLFDAHIAVSKPAQNFAKQSFGIQTIVLPNAVDVSLFSGNQPTRRVSRVIQLLFLGRLVERKGCKQLLFAVKQLRALGIENFQLSVCGDGPQRQSLEQFVTDNGLEGFVNFKGFIDEADKPATLAAADIAIFPSISGESFGIVLIEAMAAGAGVVIGGNNPGYMSVLESDETIFDPRNTEELTSLLKKLVAEEGLRAQLHARQQKLIRKYDVGDVAPKILNIYTDCIASKESR